MKKKRLPSAAFKLCFFNIFYSKIILRMTEFPLISVILAMYKPLFKAFLLIVVVFDLMFDFVEINFPVRSYKS